MTSKVKIFNLALTQLGLARVGSPDAEGDKAATLRDLYDDVLDATLEAHPWNFAEEIAQLAAMGTAPAFGFANQFAYPTDPFCLRVWRLEDRTIEWVAKGRKILTDAAGPLDVHYIKRVTDTSVFPGMFTLTFAAHLAWKSAYRLTQERTKEEDAERAWLKQLQTARSADAQEGNAPREDPSDFIDARA
jgi:hypothetical protein